MRRKLAAFDAEQDPYLLGLARLAFAAMLLRHTLRLGSELRRGAYFGDRFHMPILPEAWVPSRSVYGWWLVSMALAALAALLGVRARAALLFTASSGLYLLLCDRLQYHNNRYALLLLAFLLAFTPCDRSFTLARNPAPRLGPAWAVWLMRMQLSLIYLASAGSKLLDPDWRGGQVMLLRGLDGIALAAARGIELPGFASALLGSALAMSVFSKLAIATEFFLAIGLWLPRLRASALWIGTLFHLGIEIGATVELFSYVMWSGYLVFVTPALRERTLCFRADSPRACRLASFVRTFDWLARFRVEVTASANTPAFSIRDRDGRRFTGWRGLAAVARAIPLLFWLWPPLRVWAAVLEPKRAA